MAGLACSFNGLQCCHLLQAPAAPAEACACAATTTPSGEGQEPARIENAAFDLTPDLTPSQSPAKAAACSSLVAADNPLFC
jgi:hypothetical protein